MIGDTVAIEIPDAVSERDEGRAIGACEAALGRDRCTVSGEGGDPVWTARVTQSSAVELTIELLHTGQEDVTTVRVLRFSDDELEAFRWQSAGVVVAALVLSQVRPDPELEPLEESEPKPAEEPAEEPLPIPPREREGPGTPREKDADVRDHVTLDVAPLLASSATGAGIAGGAWIAGALRLKGPLHLVAQGDATFSTKNEEAANLQATALSGSLGLGLRGELGSPQWILEASARGAIQSLGVRASSGETSGEASTVRTGARAGVGLAWRPSGFLGVVVGGDAGVLWPPVDVEVGRDEPLRVPALFWGGYLGLRIRLNRL